VATVAPTGAGQGESLVAVKPVAVVDVQGSQVNFTLPNDTFASTQADASVQLAATQVDGSALPGWLAFNPQTGSFVGQPPAGVTGEVVVRVVARDQDGREAIATVRINVGAGGGVGAPQGQGDGQGPGQGQGDGQGEAPQAPGQQGELAPDPAAPAIKLSDFGPGQTLGGQTFAGKPTFQDQLRMASRLSGARQAHMLAAARAVARNA
jgi:hypothetical protein